MHKSTFMKIHERMHRVRKKNRVDKLHHSVAANMCDERNDNKIVKSTQECKLYICSVLIRLARFDFRLKESQRPNKRRKMHSDVCKRCDELRRIWKPINFWLNAHALIWHRAEKKNKSFPLVVDYTRSGWLTNALLHSIKSLSQKWTSCKPRCIWM